MSISSKKFTHCPRCGNQKEAERHNRPHCLCVACEGETRCKHRVSMMEDSCKAGVVFEALRERMESEGCRGWPCFWSDSSDLPVVQCTSFEPVGVEACRELDAEIAASLARMLACGPVTKEVKQEHKGEDWSGVKPCPICGGNLHMTHAAYNGHVWGQCETKDCVSWME